MNNILNKIAQMERNAAEIKGVELAKHEVELAMIQLDTLKSEIVKTIKEGIDYYEKTKSEFENSKTQLTRRYEYLDKKANKTLAEYTSKAKELGLAPNDIPNLKDMWDTMTEYGNIYRKIIK